MKRQKMRELDAWIGINVFGKHEFKPHHTNNSLCAFCNHGYSFEGHFNKDWVAISESLPCYTTNNAAAMLVLKEVAKKRTADGYDQYRPDATLCISAPHPDWNNEWVIMSDPCGKIIASGPTFEIAVCLFAQKIFEK